MPLSKLDICKMVCDELPTQRIDALDDGSFEAETIVQAYDGAKEYLLEDHDWDFAVVRVTLASVTNDRAAEWEFAYQIPASLLRPRHILPYGSDYDASGNPTYPNYGRLRAYEAITPFRLAGTVIYTNMENGIFEFVTRDVAEDRFTAKFARALALEIAKRVVMPIKKDRKRQGELMQMAELERQRAKADDMNRDRESARDFIPEVQLVRSGILPWQ